MSVECEKDTYYKLVTSAAWWMVKPQGDILYNTNWTAHFKMIKLLTNHHDVLEDPCLC